MGKKTKKSTKKQKEDEGIRPEEYEWLLKKTPMAEKEKLGISAKHIADKGKATVPQCSGVDFSSSTEVSETPNSSSLGGDCSVNVKGHRTKQANSLKTVNKGAVQVFDEMSEPNPLAGSGGKGESLVSVSSPSISRTLGEEDSIESAQGNQLEKSDEGCSPRKVESPVKAKSTWASLFQSNREVNDNLTLSVWVNDDSSIKLEVEDADTVAKAWGFGLIGYVAGKFPGKGAIHSCCKSWGVKFQLHFHASGWLLFKFSSEMDRDEVLRKGPYYIYGRPLLLKVMPDMFKFNDSEISKVPVWVQFPSLPLEFWNVRALSKITSKLGTPKQADKLTISRDRVSYARVLVEIDVTQPLKEELCIIDPNGQQFSQEVRYEYVPKFCGFCKSIGHVQDKCPYYKASIPAAPVVKRSSGPTLQAIAPVVQTKTPFAVVETHVAAPTNPVGIIVGPKTNPTGVVQKASGTSGKGKALGTKTTVITAEASGVTMKASGSVGKASGNTVKVSGTVAQSADYQNTAAELQNVPVPVSIAEEDTGTGSEEEDFIEVIRRVKGKAKQGVRQSKTPGTAKQAIKGKGKRKVLKNFITVGKLKGVTPPANI